MQPSLLKWIGTGYAANQPSTYAEKLNRGREEQGSCMHHEVGMHQIACGRKMWSGSFPSFLQLCWKEKAAAAATVLFWLDPSKLEEDLSAQWSGGTVGGWSTGRLGDHPFAAPLKGATKCQHFLFFYMLGFLIHSSGLSENRTFPLITMTRDWTSWPADQSSSLQFSTNLRMYKYRFLWVI